MPLDDTSAIPFADLPNRAPAAHLLDLVDPASVPTPVGYNVLVLQYVRPEKVGSLFMPEQAKREDEFQGAVGIVLAVGPDAYSGSKFTSGPWVKPGDWVAWPRLKATATKFAVMGGHGKSRVVFAVLADDSFTAKGVDPERLSV